MLKIGHVTAIVVSLLIVLHTVNAQEPAADATMRERDWWKFHGNEYWNLFFPGGNKDAPKPATIVEQGKTRVLTIGATDKPVTVGLYGGNRDEKISLLRNLQRIDFDVDLDAGPAMQLVLTLRDAKGEKWRFAPRTLDPGTQTITWRFPKDIEEVYHGEPANRQVDDALHLFNVKLDRPASDGESRVVFKGARVIERVPATESLDVSLQTTAEYPVIYEANADEAKLVIRNTGDRGRRGEVTLQVRDGQREPSLVTHAFDIPPGQQQSWPLDHDLGCYGIKTLGWSVKVNGDVKEGRSDFAYFKPVGNEGGRDDPFKFSIGGAESETDYAIMAAIGVEGVRMGGNWVHREPQPGTFTWDRTDEEVEAFARHGFDMQYLVSYGHPAYAREPWATELKAKRWPLQTVPPQLDAWNRWLRELATRYDGKITHFEIWNEPDLSAFWKGSTDDYIELLKASHQTLKSVNPNNVVMTGGFATAGHHGGHDLNPDLQRRVVQEAADYYDIHTHHQHGGFRGFAEAVDGKLAQWREPVADRKPLWFNETAISVKQAGGDLAQAQTLAKKMSFAFARGAQSYAWFVFYAGGSGHVSEFAMIHGEDYQPRPALVAYNELARQLRDLKFVQQLDPGSGRFILHFADTEAGEHLFVHWHEEATAGRVPLLVRMPQGATARRIDLMGNSTAVDANQGLAMVAVGDEPAYLRITGAASGLQIVTPILTLAGTVVTADGDGNGEAAVVLSNPLPEPAEVELVWKVGDRAVASDRHTVPAGGRRDLTQRFDLADQEGQPDLRVTATLMGSKLSQQLVAPIVTTRRIAATPVEDRDPDFTLDRQADVVNYFMNDPGNLSRTWSGPKDLSAQVWLQPTEQGLRLVVAVSDDVHQQPNPASKLWQGDSLQVGLAAPSDSGFFEIGLARSDNDQPLKHVFTSPVGRSLRADQIQLQTQRLQGLTRYDALLPWSMFGQDRPTDLRFNIVINDRDEGVREGVIRLAPGIDADKDPTRFALIRLRH